MMTNKEFWLSRNGKMRTARKNHRCDSKDCDRGTGCTGQISPGDLYLDSGEIKSAFTAFKYCLQCAESEAVL